MATTSATSTDGPAVDDGHDTSSSGSGSRLTLAAVLLCVAGMACFGSATPVSAIVGRHFPVWMGSFLRMLVAAVVLVGASALVRRRRRFAVPEDLRTSSAADRVRILAMTVVGTFGFSAAMLLGMREAPGSVAAVVMATTPAVTAIGAVVFLRDRLSGWQIGSLVLAVVGVVVVETQSGSASSAGGAVVLGSALVFAAVCCEATFSLVGKQLTANLSPVEIAATVAVVSSVLFAPLALWDATHMSWGEPQLGDWLAVLWWGAGTFALGSWLWFEGMARTSPGRASTFMAVMPVSALIGSYLLLGESFRWIHAVGLGLVLVGLVLVVRSGSTLH